MTEKDTKKVKILVGKNVKILGPGCPKCHKAEHVIKEALVELGVSADVEKVTDTMEIVNYGVFVTPAVVVDGDVKSVGKIPDKDQIKSWFEE